MFYKRHLSPLHRIDQAAFNGGFSPTATVEGDSKEERDGTMGDRGGRRNLLSSSCHPTPTKLGPVK